MKKISILKTTILVIIGLFLSLVLLQCRKVGFNAERIDRSFIGIPDSTVFASFYDETTISASNAVPSANDKIIIKGVLSTIKEYCGISTCHGGPISPKLVTYAEITKLVTPGNPETSKLWELITTNNLNKAMPPVSAAHELSLPDKNIIYNWIKNGAKEYPELIDFRPAAINIIITGCSSANCHNVATSTGAWAKAGLLGPLQTSDTATFTHIRGTSVNYYVQLLNKTKLNQEWNLYKDSVRKFYSDTIGKASFRPYKTFSAPILASGVRGPLSSYDDIILDIWYPKGLRSNSNCLTSSPTVRGDYLNAISFSSSCAISTLNYFIPRFDSTLLRANPRTQGDWSVAGSNDGDMAYADGGLTPSEIALIKAWYFADPNIPDVWKYGINNTGIFKYKKPPNTIIVKR